MVACCYCFTNQWKKVTDPKIAITDEEYFECENCGSIIKLSPDSIQKVHVLRGPQ